MYYKIIMVKVLIPMATDSEELEAIAVVNVLRRAKVQVVIASTTGNKVVKCARDTKIECDELIETVKDDKFDAIILPGGMPGATSLGQHSLLQTMLKKQKSESNLYGAICASPAKALCEPGLLKDISKATCYPAPAFVSLLGDKYTDTEDVVVSENCVTSKGPGTAVVFGLKIVELLVSKDEAKNVAKDMLVQY